jgi:hypothetical protein
VIHAVSDYDEISFGGENGGCYTHEKFSSGNVVMHNDLVHNTAGPNRTQIWLWLRKPGEIKGITFRQKLKPDILSEDLPTLFKPCSICAITPLVAPN